MTNSLPTWVVQPFRDMTNHAEELNKILDISIRGISMLRGVPNLIEVLRDTAEEDEEEGYGEEGIESAHQEAALAQSEVENDFPILHSQITIALWSSLESLVRTFLVAWLTNIADAKSCDELKKVRVRLGEYESLVGDDQNYYLLDLLEDSMSTRRSPGIGRFEALFSAFGLSSKIDDETSKTLFELYHVRNVFVHRSGIADRKIVAACPWLNLSVGDTVTVSHQAYLSYWNAVADYVRELAQRTRVYFGLGRYRKSAPKPAQADILDSESA